MARMPKMLVNRCIGSGFFSAFDNSFDELSPLFWPSRADAISVLQYQQRIGEFCVGIIMQGGDVLPAFDRVAGFLVQFESHRVVDLVILFIPPAAQDKAGQPNLLALDGFDVTIARRFK